MGFGPGGGQGSGWSRRWDLAPWLRGHPDYRATYDGDLRARDAAYHQGTVWPWLIGPFVEAWLPRDTPRTRAPARHLLDRFWTHLNEACVGSISEIFRRGAPVHASRMHRSGLERGRGAPRARPDGGTRADGARPRNARSATMTDVTARAVAVRCRLGRSHAPPTCSWPRA